MLTPDYVSGLFDGEGMASLIYTKRRAWKSDPSKQTLGFRFVVGISNTNEEILPLLRDQFGGDISVSTKAKKQHHKDVYSWKIGGAELQRQFLLTVQPTSIIKRRQIELGLRYLETSVEPGKRVSPGAWNERLAIFAELREVNRRGTGIEPRNTIPAAPTEGWNPKRRGYGDEELAEMMTHVRAGLNHSL